MVICPLGIWTLCQGMEQIKPNKYTAAFRTVEVTSRISLRPPSEYIK